MPEFGWWTSQQEHAATQRALADLERLLRTVTGSAAADQRRAALARAPHAPLDRPIVADGDLPNGVVVPTVAAGYIDPHVRLRAAPDTRSVSDETAWDAAQPRNNLSAFLAAHLTAPVATEVPLLVLGQPGAGKSVLTRILAGRLPIEDLLPVRVELREVPAAVLARTRGLHIAVAVAWRRASAGDWTGYAADITRRVNRAH